MTIAQSTLLLTQDTWDLCLDASGNIAVASPPYAVAQDVASAIKTFLGEIYYDTGVGIPYFEQILGKSPPLQLVKSQFINAALTVPGVTSALVFFSSFTGRELSGQVQITFNAPVSPATPTGVGQALIFFVGDNGGLVVFVGDNGGVVEFVGII
jgi:hypothetical protein